MELLSLLFFYHPQVYHQFFYYRVTHLEKFSSLTRTLSGATGILTTPFFNSSQNIFVHQLLEFYLRIRTHPHTFFWISTLRVITFSPPTRCGMSLLSHWFLKFIKNSVNLLFGRRPIGDFFSVFSPLWWFCRHRRRDTYISFCW